MRQLRAIVRHADGGREWLEAQLLELDIAVSASTYGQLVKEIEHALVMEYQIAIENNRTPFAAIVNKTPSAYTSWWAECETSGTKNRSLNLPREVSLALAMILHSLEQTPTFAIQEFRLAA